MNKKLGSPQRHISPPNQNQSNHKNYRKHDKNVDETRKKALNQGKHYQEIINTNNVNISLNKKTKESNNENYTHTHTKENKDHNKDTLGENSKTFMNTINSQIGKRTVFSKIAEEIKKIYQTNSKEMTKEQAYNLLVNDKYLERMIEKSVIIY